MGRGQKAAAVRAASSALEQSKGIKTRFLAGRIFALAGEAARARAQAAGLASELGVEPQAFAKILEANVLLAGGLAPAAIATLIDANKILDTWIGRFDLVVRTLEGERVSRSGRGVERCLTRRGEALSLFLDEVPSYGYFPPVHYYLGRVREGLKLSSYVHSYKTFIAIRGEADQDSLVADARKRLP